MQHDGVKIAISGGTFDPIHHGHLIMAEELRQQFGFDKVLFIPSGNPPHKKNIEITGAQHRLEMVNRAIASNKYFDASEIEVQREGYTYTVDTLAQMKSIYGSSSRLFFIIGADVVYDLLTWKNIEKVFTMCEFAAVMRPGFDEAGLISRIEMLKENYGAVINTAKAPMIEISSTAIRERVKSGKSIKYLVPDAVESYIREHGLYK